MSSKLNDSLAKIERAYEAAKQKGLTFNPKNENKERLDDDSYKTYCDVMKAYNVYLNDNYGISDITRAKPHHAYEYAQKMMDGIKAGEASAYTLGKFVSSINSFYYVTKESGVYKNTVKIGDARKIRETMAEQGIKRKSSESTTLKATNDECGKVRNELLSSKSPHAETYVNMSRVQQELGGRATATFSLKAGDVRIYGDRAVVTFEKDKGGLTREVVTYDRDTIQLLSKLTESKKDGSPLFQIKDRDGNDKSKDDAVKQYKQAIQAAAERADVNRNNQTFSSHSFRKNFAQNRYESYRRMSRAELEKLVERRTEDKDLEAKYNKTLETINNKFKQYRTSKDPDKEHVREMTDKELALWLTSVDLGHGRLDVMRYYVDSEK